MFIKINFDSEIPIYVQLKNEIIKAVAYGALKDGESLPSVRSLGNDLGINLHTVNKAYNMLKDEGYVSIDRRKGAIVKTEEGNIKEKIHEDLELLVCEAYIKGVEEEEVVEMIKNIYYKIGKK